MRFLLAVGSLFFVGCNVGSQESTRLAAPEIARFSKMNVNTYPVTKTVCNPLGGTADPRSNAGLKAELFYINGTPSTTINNIQDVITNGEKAMPDIFLGDLIVPTRRFELGFSNQLGQTLKNMSGETLIEWFALRMKTVLHLRPDQAEGTYEFASLSDDGSLLKIRNDSGVYETTVDNDGTHPTRLACSNKTYNFSRDTEKLAQVLYHQGPRYHISLIMLMRKVNGAQTADPACGVTGNSTWFNYDKNSEPQKAYTDLLARGWEPLTADNYSLPNDSLFNPCMDGVEPKILNARVTEMSATSLTVVWETDIPATSQVSYGELNATDWNITTATNQLTKYHLVNVVGLKPNTTYQLRPVSISDTYGKGIGPPLLSTTY